MSQWGSREWAPDNRLRDIPGTCRDLTRATRRLLRFQRKADLEGYLIVRNLAVLDVPSGFNDFKPIHVPNGLAGQFDGRADGILNAGLGRADDFKNLVNMIFHVGPSRPIAP